ncbi:hypothetical protein BG015_008974 [Linnemannia schmuckeri]|uniref:Uncharacterized protein n=1 Tax=Linnemannia schmuckeri TaxID=64567 RepID=A0A9P5VAA5_9FUNG|nr:hypothetical protein BG015_008974 [Linnemannia schmuckeri]
MSSSARRSSVSIKKKAAGTSTKVPTGHRVIRESFGSPEPQDTKQQHSSAPEPTQHRQIEPFPETPSEDSNTLISITQLHQSTDSTPPLASPSRLTRQRAKEQRNQASQSPFVGTPTLPTSTGAKRKSSSAQHPTLDNVTARWRRLTSGIPTPEESAECKVMERKSRKLTESDSTMTTSFSASGQKAVTPSAPVGGNEDSLDYDGPNETMRLNEIEGKSSTSQTRKTATRSQR